MTSTPLKANKYDQMVRKTIPLYETIHKEVIELIQTLRPDFKTWLDTGCGTGYLIKLVSQKFSHRRFFLSDPSKDYTNTAKKNIKNKNNKFEFVNYGSENLPINELPKFDIATAILSHVYFQPEKRVRATENCYRILKKGGIYITLENILPNSKKTIALALDHWMFRQKKQGKTEKQVEAQRKFFNTGYFPITINEHLKILKNAGFKTREIFWYSYMQAGFYAIK